MQRQINVAVQLEEVLPTRLKSAVTCGGRFSPSNCVDSDLIIIKTTCTTVCGPWNGADFLIQSLNWAMVEKGLLGRGHERVLATGPNPDLWLINNLRVCRATVRQAKNLAVDNRC